MKLANKGIISVILCLSCMPVSSEASELSLAPFWGYSFGASDLETRALETDSQGDIRIGDASHYGVILGLTTADPGDIYLMYSHQRSELRGANSFSPDHLTDLDVDYFHLGGSLYFPHGAFRPYVTVSVGVAQMRPSGDLSNESRFSMGIGGGLAYQITKNLILFTDARAMATFVNSDNELFCDASECFWHIRADLMWQGQVNAGVKLSF